MFFYKSFYIIGNSLFLKERGYNLYNIINRTKVSKKTKSNNLLREIKKNKFCYVGLIPTILLLIIFNYYPPLSGIYHAFFDWDAARAVFVGLGNFEEIMRDEILAVSLKNVIKLILFALLVTNIMPMLVAEILFNMKNDRTRYYYQVLFLLPMVVPGVVTILLWQFIYDGQVGLLNSVLRSLGLGHLQRAWLGSSDTALFALMFMGFPWISGTTTMIYLAGLQSIPQSVFDAAALDGVYGFSRFIKIDFPLILGQVKLLVILGVIEGLQSFGVQLVLTQGGPGVSTMVPGYHMFQQAFTMGRFGYACAIGLLMFLFMLLFTYLNMKYIKSEVQY